MNENKSDDGCGINFLGGTLIFLLMGLLFLLSLGEPPIFLLLLWKPIVFVIVIIGLLMIAKNLDK